MKPLTLALAPLILAASPAVAQSHAGHAGHAPAASAPAQQATPPALEPAHDCPMMREGRPCPMHGKPPEDPHAGHDMSGMQMAPAQTPAADPHAGHDMSGMRIAPAQASTADPHAGHDMSGMQMAPAQTPAVDPHAGHDMSGMQTAPAQTPAVDPHAGHDMSGMQTAPVQTPAADPHAGHDMSGMTGGAPNIPTSVDSVGGRMVETPPPPAARAAPAHAADLLFDPAVMAAARKQLLVENGDVRTTAVLVDSIEANFGDGEEGYSWKAQGWTGGDINRFWWKTEGEGDFGGKLHEVEVQALYSRAIAPFWDVQAGVRQDFRPDGDDTTHLTVGVQGVAPYWFEMNAAAFLSTEGDLTARAEVEYDQRITQKWIVQPALELEMSANDIPELEIGSGLTSVTAGLRLRYEIRKEFAPYVGVEWSRSLGDTAHYAKARGEDAEDVRLVVGIKAWF
ncbi:MULTISPECIES: copper resistance protein B [Brevundimonas]|uniref:copper resistance protein B n=1 Tax=Brevundimonas vesicularis TaxID=41276 RepID=UPI0028B01097|nr:copper resistance protein B [Brevundimonas diminuta]